jgi:signal transduction histidine kinase
LQLNLNVVKYFLITFLLGLSFVAEAQNLDLIRKLKSEIKGSEKKKRFALLTDLAWEYRWSSPDSTILFASEAFEIGKDLNLTKDLAKPVNFIGVAYNYKGDRIKAYDFYDKALNISTIQKDSAQIAYSNNNLGRLFFEQGVLSRSYEYFIRSLALFEAVNDSSGLAYTYQSLANLYKSQRDFKKAERHYLIAYKMRISLGNTRDIMSALGQLGRLYQDNNQHSEALNYLHKADSAGRIIHDEINLAEVKTLIAESYLHQNKLDEAEKICQEGLDEIIRVNNIRMMPQAYLTMGQIKLNKQDLKGSRKFFNLAMNLSTQSKDLNSKMESHYWLWKLSEKEHNQSDVLRNHNEYLILKDSVKDLDLARQVERLQFEIEIGRKEQENGLLKANQETTSAVIEQQRLENIILIIVVVSFSLLVIVQWRGSVRRQAINRKLAEQNQFIQRQRQEIIQQNEKLSRRNQELSDLNYEKDTLMSIVAHDLKSPLNRIRGMVEIMELEGGLTSSQRTYLEMTKQATRAGLDLIKDLLDVHMLQENTVPHFSVFDISEFIYEKTKAFEPVAEGKAIHLNISHVISEDVNMDLNYIGRIIDNLLSNAIKFSKPKSVVDIAAGKEEDHFWISVKDQGPGFNDKDRNQLFQRFKKLSARPTGGESSNGLGLAIVKTLVDRLNGSIELISSPEKGSEFIIKLPIVAVLQEKEATRM